MDFAGPGRRWAGLFRLAAVSRRGSRQPRRANAQKAARAAVRVTIAPVEKTDFPVYLTGLGTVQAFNTVVVRSRVDGQIDKIAFKEGQLVKQGDLLAEIDPRPYQAALDQAKAKKEQDEANLANINLDLQRYHQARRIRDAAAARYPALHRVAIDGTDRGRRSRHRQRADPARLYRHQGADLRRRRLAPGRYRQHRQCRDPDRHCHDRADRADRRDFHRAGRPIALYQGRAGRRAAQDHRDHDRRQEAAGGRNAGGGQQSGRYDQRHHPPQGRVRQQGPCAVAGPVGLDPAPGADDEGCHGGSGRRDPARHRGPLRFHRQSGQQGRAAQGQGQPVDRRTLGDRARPVTRTAGYYRRASSRFSPAPLSAPPWRVRIRRNPKVQPE